MIKRTLAIMLLTGAIASCVPANITAVADYRQPTIIMDMAHRDTINDCGASYQIWNERDIVNPITERVANILVNKGFNVLLTREYDKPISINERIALANRTDYDYYISIHANSCEEANKGTGIEAFYNGKGAELLGETMLNAYNEEFGSVIRRNEETPYYTRHIDNSVLLEIGFINNDNDRKIMLENQEEIAQLMADTIIQHYAEQTK